MCRSCSGQGRKAIVVLHADIKAVVCLTGSVPSGIGGDAVLLPYGKVVVIVRCSPVPFRGMVQVSKII